jgi:hypothetical protein
MNTIELIKLLKSVEYGASGRPREISLYIGKDFISKPEIKIEGTGDGCAGAELILKIDGCEFNKKRIAELESILTKVVECVPKPENVEWIYDEQCEEYYYMVKELEQFLQEVQEGGKWNEETTE